MVTEGQPISRDDINALISYAQLKLKKTYSVGKWLKKFNDIRRDAYENLVSGETITDHRLLTSGPWCIWSGNDMQGFYSDVFWVGEEEEGRVIKCTCNSPWSPNKGGLLSTETGAPGGWNGVRYKDPGLKKAKWEIKLGGDRPARFTLKALAELINLDSVIGALPSVTVDSNIPGLTHNVVNPDGVITYQPTCSVWFASDGIIPPGDYYIRMTVTDPVFSYYMDTLLTGYEYAVEGFAQIPHGGIHDSKRVIKMEAPAKPGEDELPFGIYIYQVYPRNPGPPPWKYRLEVGGIHYWQVTGSPTGRWFAKTQPINSREVQLQAYINPNTPPKPGPWAGPIYDFYRSINPAKEASKSQNPKIVNATPAVTYRIAYHNVQRDTDPVLPFSGYQWPFWYIRKVIVRKLPRVDPKSKIASQEAGPVEFSLGCFRNGVYEPFPGGGGSVDHGGAILDVYWPVFHQSPLVYQCSERLAIYAYVSWEHGRFGGTTWQNDITFPILAAHYNDTMKMLQLIE